MSFAAWEQHRVGRQITKMQIGSLHHITDDSDFEFRNRENMTDSYVMSKLAREYRDKVLNQRAQYERELQLEAFNHLNGTSIKDE